MNSKPLPQSHGPSPVNRKRAAATRHTLAFLEADVLNLLIYTNAARTGDGETPVGYHSHTAQQTCSKLAPYTPSSKTAKLQAILRVSHSHHNDRRYRNAPA